MRHPPPTEKENIREALTYLSPDLPREDWAKIGMAIKAALNHDAVSYTHLTLPTSDLV